MSYASPSFRYNSGVGSVPARPSGGFDEGSRASQNVVRGNRGSYAIVPTSTPRELLQTGPQSNSTGDQAYGYQVHVPSLHGSQHESAYHEAQPAIKVEHDIKIEPQSPPSLAVSEQHMCDVRGEIFLDPTLSDDTLADFHRAIASRRDRQQTLNDDRFRRQETSTFGRKRNASQLFHSERVGSCSPSGQPTNSFSPQANYVLPRRPCLSQLEKNMQESWDCRKLALALHPRTCNATRLHEIIALLQAFLRGNEFESQEKLQDILNWLDDVQCVDIGQDHGTTVAQVVAALSDFLEKHNSALRQERSLPTFVEEELTFLCAKWRSGDFEGSHRRGLVECTAPQKDGKATSTVRWRATGNWKHFQHANQYGHNGLVNGQIFFSREELRRDGVHAATEAGIAGSSKRLGAYSVLLSRMKKRPDEGYADIDQGDIIEYMGTASKDSSEPTHCTKALMRSLATREPVRVIRKIGMPDPDNKKVISVYRYDGLYVVVNQTLIQADIQSYRFRMERLTTSQGPLRGYGPASATEASPAPGSEQGSTQQR